MPVKWRGVPIFKTDPKRGSRARSTCGRIHDSRMGEVVEGQRDWRLKKHAVADIDLLQTAISKGVAGGLRFDPGAFQHDVMMTLYDPATGARSEPNGTSGICVVT